MKKRILSMCMVAVLLSGFLLESGCGMGKTAETAAGTEVLEDELLTRAEWITGLGSVFGMNDYTTTEPYFEDVAEADELFPYVQSCSEWGIFTETGGEFLPEENATREFAIETAVLAASVLDEEQTGDVKEACVSYAVQEGIIESEKDSYLAEEITYGEGQNILDWALDAYQNREFTEYSNVEWNDDLMDFSDCEMTVDEDTVTIPADSQEIGELSEGDVFLASPTEDAPDGVAKKVVSVTTDEQGNRIVETAEPEVEDIYKELDFAVRAVPQAEDIVVYDGVTLADASDDDTLVYASAEAGGTDYLTVGGGGFRGSEEKKGSSFTFSFSLKNGMEPKVSAEWEESFAKFKEELSDRENVDEEAEKLFEKSDVLYKKGKNDTGIIDKIENKYTKSYEITGSMKFENVYIDVSAEPKKLLGVPVGVEDFYCQVHYKLTSTLNLKGSLKEELTIATVPIKTPVPGLTVKVSFVLYINEDGELELKCVTSSTTTYEYASGCFKKTTNTTMDSAEISAALKLESGAELKVTPTLVGLNIIDVKVKCGEKLDYTTALKTEIEERETQNGTARVEVWIWDTEIKAIKPVVTLKIGGDSDDNDDDSDDAKKNKKKERLLIEISDSWELVGEKGALVKVTPDTIKLSYNLGEVVLETIENTETSEEQSEMTEATEVTESTETLPNGGEILDIDTYTMTLAVGETGQIAVTSIPEGYEESDLTWSVDDSEVASVSGGTVSAKAGGVAVVTVSTSDGKFTMSCNVIVSDEEGVEFEEL